MSRREKFELLCFVIATIVAFVIVALLATHGVAALNGGER